MTEVDQMQSSTSSVYRLDPSATTENLHSHRKEPPDKAFQEYNQAEPIFFHPDY
jgi:hypothetical protein